jgi:hypothetical protein
MLTRETVRLSLALAGVLLIGAACSAAAPAADTPAEELVATPESADPGAVAEILPPTATAVVEAPPPTEAAVEVPPPAEADEQPAPAPEEPAEQAQPPAEEAEPQPEAEVQPAPAEVVPGRPSAPAPIDSDFRADPASVVGATGNPQLIEFFTYW